MANYFVLSATEKSAQVGLDMSILIGELDLKEIPQACELFHRVFGQTISPSHWHWKYTQGPRLGGLNLVARTPAGELVGHVGSSIFPGVLGASQLSMAQVCDVLVDRSARGGLDVNSVYPRLIKALQQALQTHFVAPYAYGFAGVRPFKLGSRMGFYRELQQCRPGYFGPPEASRWGSALWTAREAAWDTHRLDKICTRQAQASEQPIVLRTGAYLTWRYHQHPVNSYRLWFLRHLMRDRGWFITRAMPNGELCIVDAMLPKLADPLMLTAALATALAASPQPATPIYAWFLPASESQGVEPIIGSEVKVNHWHTQFPSPRFQPGDTDVY